MEGRDVGLAARVEALPLGISPTGYRAPKLRPGTVPRDDLVKRLLSADWERIVGVSAPGGYGKTTTVRLWQEADDRDFAWVQIGRLDNDPVHLLRHVALPLDELAPLSAATVKSMTGPGRSADLDMLPALVGEFSRRDPFVLVLDDVHLLTSDDSRRCLATLIAAVPEGSQIALVGRSLPVVGLSRRRLDRGVLALGVEDLAMSEDEASEILCHAGVAVSHEELGSLVARTEGWPGGLHLAGLALGRADGTNAVISGRNRLVADYLVEEVLATLDETTVEFLERSSVLARMDAGLLDEVLATEGSGRMLERIERSGNLFLVPLDSERSCYRYHHLFAELLRARLVTRDPDDARALHRRASRVLEQRGDVDAAVHHAVEAGDTARAADLVLVHAPALSLTGRTATVASWLDALGEAAVARYPAAAIAGAWNAIASGEGELIERCIAAAERAAWDGPLADGSPSVATAVTIVRAVLATGGIHGVVHHCDVVRDAGGRGTNPWWGLATAIKGTALSMMGDVDAARELLLESQSDLAAAHRAAVEAHLALIDFDAGDQVGARSHCVRALDMAERHDLEGVVPATVVYATGSLVAAVEGRGAESARLAAITRRMLDLYGPFSARTAVLCNVVLARAAIALSDLRSAEVCVRLADLAREKEPGAEKLNRQLDELKRRLQEAQLATGVDPLTPAELRLLPYLPTHLSLREIAEQLFVSRNTAKTHSVAIYRKLGVSSRGDAVDTARRLGLLDADTRP